MGQPIKPFGINTKDRKISPERLGWIISGLDWNRLNDKESEFIESCEERMKRVGELTEPMERWLEAIHRNKGR